MENNVYLLILPLQRGKTNVRTEESLATEPVKKTTTSGSPISLPVKPMHAKNT